MKIALLQPFLKVNKQPIFILGNQKSGTTAIAALLAEFANESVTLDLKGLYEPVQTLLHAGVVEFDDFVKRNKYDFSRDIIKEPCLTFLYHKVKTSFPHAKFVFIVRDPRDNIRSILSRLRVRGDQQHVISNISNSVSPEWQLILDGGWLGLHGTTHVEMLALRWNLAVDTYLNNSDEILLVRYEDFLADKLRTISELARQLNLSHVNDIFQKLDFQFQTKGIANLSWKEFFGHENLLRIEIICSDRMAKFGYDCQEISK